MLKQRNPWIQIFLHILFVLISVPLFNFISFNNTEVKNHFEKGGCIAQAACPFILCGQSSENRIRLSSSFFPLHYVQTARQKAFLPVPWFLSPSLISIFMANPYHISLVSFTWVGSHSFIAFKIEASWQCVMVGIYTVTKRVGCYL